MKKYLRETCSFLPSKENNFSCQAENVLSWQFYEKRMLRTI